MSKISINCGGYARDGIPKEIVEHVFSATSSAIELLGNNRDILEVAIVHIEYLPKDGGPDAKVIFKFVFVLESEVKDETLRFESKFERWVTISEPSMAIAYDLARHVLEVIGRKESSLKIKLGRLKETAMRLSMNLPAPPEVARSLPPDVPPTCPDCGATTTRNGCVYDCLNCGKRLGSS